MTIEEFQHLNLKEQEIATVNGYFLAVRLKKRKIVIHHAVDDFFIEAVYESFACRLVELNTFKNTKKLAPNFEHNQLLHFLSADRWALN